MSITILSDKEYFAAAAISKSQLHLYDTDNPMAFWRGCKLNPNCKEELENDAIANGKLRHTMLLEPEKVATDFKVIEGGRGFGSRDTKAFQKVIEENPDFTVVTKEEFERAEQQIKTLKGYQIVQDILKGATVEKSFFWEDKETGLPLKAKLDLLKRLSQGILIVEYKTTGKDFYQIGRGIDVMGWHWDAGMQYKAVKAKYGEAPFQMIFIVQSQKEGEENKIKIFTVDDTILQECASYVDRVLAEIAGRYEKWKLGDPTSWQTKLGFSNFIGYQGTAFSFNFDVKNSEYAGD